MRYEQGYLIEGRTRGTAKIGGIITEQLKTIRSVPLQNPV
jgi:NAD-dependent DNA ligase